MKKFNTAICILILISVLLAGCSKKSANETTLYNYRDLSKYITLGKYKDITVDSNSDDFALYFNDIKTNDLTVAEISESKPLSNTDTVANGDTVVIDFVGKMDGKAFEGGSSEDYQLTIGSNSMIDGFESGIIGAKLNKTFTIDLNFPDPYPNNTDLSGKPVSFDITVKSGTRTTYPEITDSIAKKLGFKSAKEYNDDATKRAAQGYLCDLIAESSKVKSYPEKELEYYLNATTEYYESMCESYGMTFDEFLKNQSMTMEEYEANVKEGLKSTITLHLVYYSIAQKENIAVTEKDIESYIKTTAAQNDMTVEEVKQQANEGDIEFYTLFEKVNNYLIKENEII